MLLKYYFCYNLYDFGCMFKCGFSSNFMLLFSLLGMLLFGCKFCNRIDVFSPEHQQCTVEEILRDRYLAKKHKFFERVCDCDRTNFATFSGAMLTVFQVF